MWPLDARELAAWWERYDAAKRSYVGGFIGRIAAIDALIQLRYRDDALRAEIKEWEKAREARRKEEYFARQRDRNALRRASTREKELENDARDVAASSSE
jgi:hypothetical protein